MADHLWPLLRLKTASEIELKEAYRKIFIENYVIAPNGEQVVLSDWDGKRVHFNPRNFVHAFSESSDYRFGSGEHDISLSMRRVRRILWIKEVLTASKGSIERRQQFRKDSRGRTSKKRRMLIVVEEKYVVVLEERDNHSEFDFITAFPADRNYLDKIRRESSLLDVKKEKPQS